MKILAFDTTNNTMSVAITADNSIVAEENLLQSGLQAEMLIPLIEKSLNKAGIWYQDLNLLAITGGPGSFTGVRIGFSVAKAIKLATSLPLVTASSLEVIAYDYRTGIYKEQEYNKILITSDARLGELFIQQFTIVKADGMNKIQADYPAKLIDSEDFSSWVFENDLLNNQFLLAGNAKNIVANKLKGNKLIISEEDDIIRATNLAYLSADKYNQGYSEQEVDDICYIRKPRVTKKDS